MAALSGTAGPVVAATTGARVSTTLDKTVYESSFQNFGFYAQGLHWVFFENTAYNCENMGGCLFFATSPDGVSWATPTNIGIHVTDSDWSIVASSSSVFYVRYDENYFDSFCNRPLLFGTGVLSSNGAISWKNEQIVRSPGSTEAFPNTVIRVDSNNQVWIGYQDDSHSGCGGSGLQTPHVIHSSGTNYSAWTGDTTLSTAHSNNWDIDLATLQGGEVYAAYWIGGLDLHGALYNGTSWGPDERISYASDSTDVNSFVFASGSSVYAIWYDTNSETLRFGARTSSGQWSINNIGSGEAKSASSLNRYSLPITATFDPAALKFYVYWFNTANGVIDEWSGSGNSWTKTNGAFTTASETGEYTISSYYQAVNVAGSDAFGVMWIDQSSSPYNLNFGLVTEAVRNGTVTGNFFDHLVIILMENHGLADICGLTPPPCSGSNGSPYMANLADGYGLATQYVSLSHHSYPNYIALLGGSTFGCNSDDCSLVSAPNLVDRLESAGLTWKAYMEDQNLSRGCDTTTPQPYDPAHNPFTAFSDILDNTTRCSNIVLANPSGCTVVDCGLTSDLNSASAPNFMWLTPDMCNDMHGSSACSNGCTSPENSTCATDGDNYLSSVVPNILNSNAFKTQRSALLIVFDEGNSYCPLNGTSEDCVYGVWAGPEAKNNFTSSIFYDHYSFTRTIEANWNLPSLTSNDGSATPMTEFFVNNPPLPPPSVTVGFNYSPTSPAAGQPVTFTASVSGGTTPYTYSWGFGDSGTGSGASPTHSYQADGPYDVILTVADANGNTARTSRTIKVTGQQQSQSPLTVTFTFSPSSPEEGQPVTFTASVSGGTAPYTFNWSFGDGHAGTGNPSTHTYASSGRFAVAVTATDANGTITSSSQNITVAGALTVAFTFTPSSPVAGQTVTFTSSVAGGTPPYSYSWNFGDGSTGTGAQATQTYSSPGSFTVTLKVSDSGSPQLTGTSTNTVTVSSPGNTGSTQPAYTLSWMGYDWDGSGEEKISLNGQFLASLPATSSPQNGGTYASFSLNITSFVVQGANSLTFTHADWDCGTVDSVKNLQVSNQTGIIFSNSTIEPLNCTQSLNYHFNTLALTSPPTLTASFTYNPSSPQVSQQITFTASAGGGTAPYTYNWTFGDGSATTGPTVTHTYSSVGTFSVVLTAKDSGSRQQTASSQQSVTVSNPAPSPLTSGFNYGPSSPNVGQTVSFTASATGGTQPYSYSWNFGDGSTATGSSVNHVYSSAGTFTVVLTVRDSSSSQQTANSQKSLTVTSPPPPLTASFSYNPSSPQTGQGVAFTASASGGTSPYSFSWTFGDGGSGTGGSVSHTYQTTGNYTVALTVTDSSGQKTSTTQTVTVVSPPPPLVTSFSFNPSSPNAGQSISFTGSASGGTTPYQYSWNFADSGTGSGSSVNHTYQTGGSYTVTLTVTDAGGQVAKASHTITVNAPLSASFTYSPSNPLPLLAVTFTASASGGSSPYSYSWNFGDGTTASGASVSHSYLLPGSYAVSLTVTDANGQTVTTSQTITVLTSLV